MGRPAGWMKALTGRSPMKSPGAPALRREVERLIWREIAKLLTSEDAAIAVGVWKDVTSRGVRTGAVPARGARNRSLTGCGSIPDDDSMRISHEAIYQALFHPWRGRAALACHYRGQTCRHHGGTWPIP